MNNSEICKWNELRDIFKLKHNCSHIGETYVWFCPECYAKCKNPSVEDKILAGSFKYTYPNLKLEITSEERIFIQFKYPYEYTTLLENGCLKPMRNDR